MDVVVSMMPSKRRKVYHRPNCIYVEKMKPGNRMMISEKLAISKRFCRCKYCGGLRGEARTKEMIETWEKEYKLSINYVKKTDTLYVRTTIGCWKIFLKKEIDQYLLYHKNTYNNQMPFDQAMRGDYHRQRDVKPTLSLHKLINYISAHDKAKIAIMEDYRKLPKSTAKQRKYYRQAEGKFKRLERKQSQIRLENLFKSIEAQDPSICKLALG